MKNRDLTDDVTRLRGENVRLKTDQELRQVEEFDSQLTLLMDQVTTYKRSADDFKSKYLETLRQARDVQIDYEAKLRSGSGFETEVSSLRGINE